MGCYKLSDKDTGDVIAIIAEPEIASNKRVFEFFNVGDRIKLDPEEIKGSSFEGRINLNQTFTVVTAKPSILKPSNKARYQLIQLDSKVHKDEDLTGWSNSWFTRA